VSSDVSEERIASIFRVEEIRSARNQQAELDLFFDPEDGGDVPPKRRLTLNGLHGVISQKMILFVLHTYLPRTLIICTLHLTLYF
jgi:hypothetical protein